MKRHKHSLSHYKLLTCDMGDLVPIGLIEALPGDTIQHATSLLVRMMPLMAPVMHPVSVRIHHWFVPMRLLYEGWEDFITGGKDGLGSSIPYPTNAAPSTYAKGTLGDYLGVPAGVMLPAGEVSLLPFRAYNMIFNEWYRDQDLVTEVSLDSNAVQKIAWDKDYFTTARPWTQKGPAVTLPLGTTAPVITGAEHDTNGMGGVRVRDDDGTVPNPLDVLGAGADTFGRLMNPVAGMAAEAGSFYFSNLYADLTGATASDILEIRRAFALQRYQEARAQFGSRYTEYLRYLGVRSSDARLQRPEYLGGGKQTVAFSEVLRTGNLEATPDNTQVPVGEMKGHGIAALRSNRYRYFAEEHGYIVTMLSLRPRSMYVNGLPRTFSKRTKEDYYQKELENIGQQEVFNREVFATNNAGSNAGVFGYQDRYAEYRHEYSNIAGDFRDTLNHWHLARSFALAPTLNSSFINCDPSKRIFAVQNADTCWIMANHSIQARRMVGKRTIGRVL